MSISVGGLISGLDTNAMIEQLLEIQQQPIVNLQQKEAAYQVELTTYGSLQGLLPGRLSSYETVYALTIHKSQGAEIGEVVVVLPAQASAVVTRELLYTAVTRAKDRVKIKTKRSVFDLAVAAKIKRHSGLAEWL